MPRQGEGEEEEEGVEYSRFQVTGMIEGFFGFEILDFAIFLGRKILATVFLVA